VPIPVLTSNAVITCIHGGQVTLIPRQVTAFSQGGALLCVPDLVGAPIVGCPQPVTPTSKPCTLVAATMPGSFSTTLLVGGRPAYLTTLIGITDGVPPGSLVVVSPGQTSTLA
jgi:hypothetical protein